VARHGRVWAVGLVATLAAMSAACGKTTLQGQLDVPGGDPRLVAVRIVPEKEIADYLAKKVPEALTALDERRTEFERSGREADAATRDYQLASSGANSIATTRDGVQVVGDKDHPGEGTYTYDTRQHTQAEAEALARAGLADATRQREANALRFSQERAGLDQTRGASAGGHEAARARLLAWETDMLADLPAKGTVVYPDEHGTFTAKVPRGGKVAVFVVGDVKIEGMLQHRGWGVWVKTDAAEAKVRLDANNLLLSEPSESVLK
jgi:hypothetical protein